MLSDFYTGNRKEKSHWNITKEDLTYVRYLVHARKDRPGLRELVSFLKQHNKWFPASPPKLMESGNIPSGGLLGESQDT